MPENYKEYFDQCEFVSNGGTYWVKMKPIGEKGHGFFIVNEEYFNECKEVNERDKMFYILSLQARAYETLKEVKKMLTSVIEMTDNNLKKLDDFADKKQEA